MWSKKVLHLPACLWGAYEGILSAHNLLAACIAGTGKMKIYGGEAKAESEEHFTYRFANSISRMCYLVQPQEAIFTELSLALQVSFGAKDIFVLDLAAGTGAGLLGILAAMIELRESNCVPKLPLNVHVHAADISPTALAVYDELIEALAPALSQVAIRVTYRATIWNASDIVATNLLCNSWLSEVGSSETFVLISNLSGVGRALLEDFKRSFQHVTERVSHLPNTLLWVEPGGKSVTDFLKKASQIIFGPATWFQQQGAHGAAANYKWFHQLQAEKKELPGSLQILNFRRSEG